jgi:hypothetical protein
MHHSEDHVGAATPPGRRRQAIASQLVIGSDLLPWSGWMLLALLAGVLFGRGVCVALAPFRARSDRGQTIAGGGRPPAAYAGRKPHEQARLSDPEPTGRDQAEARRLLAAADRRRHASSELLQAGSDEGYEAMITDAEGDRIVASRLRLEPRLHELLPAYLEAQAGAFRAYRQALAAQRSSAPGEAERLLDQAHRAAANTNLLRRRVRALLAG